MIQSKRGVSTVVATVLIVLVTIVITAIIAQTVIKFTNDELTKSKECLDYRDYFTFEESLGYTCIQKRPSGSYYGFSVRAAVGESDLNGSIQGFNIVLTKDASSKVASITRGQIRSTAVGGVWMVGSTSNLELPSKGEVISYVYNSASGDYTKAELYPVLSSGRICEMSDSIRFQPCVEVDLSV